eukprot:2305412-Rhodomonas_salina.1
MAARKSSHVTADPSCRSKYRSIPFRNPCNHPHSSTQEPSLWNCQFVGWSASIRSTPDQRATSREGQQILYAQPRRALTFLPRSVWYMPMTSAPLLYTVAV